jgi:MscS family membrane protein
MTILLLPTRYVLLLSFWLMPLGYVPLQAQRADTPAISQQQQQEPDRERSRLQPGSSSPAEQPRPAPAVPYAPPLWKAFWVLVVLATAYFLVRLLTAALQLRAERSKNASAPSASLLSLIRLGIWVLAAGVVAAILLPAGIGSLILWAVPGIALALAVQDILKNLLGGLSLLTDAPFVAGDKIRIGPHYGEVLTIGLRFTHLRLQDDSVIAIPNALFLNTSLSNATGGESSCQVVVTLYLPLSIDTNQLRQLALEATHVSRYVYQNKPVSVLFSHELRHTKTWLKMEVLAFVLDIQYELAFRSEITELLMRELSGAGLVVEQ